MVDEIADGRPHLDDLHGLRQAVDHRSDHRHAAQRLHQPRGDVGRVQARHDQDIGRAGEAGERIGRLQELEVERHVGLHLAVILEVDLLGIEQADRLADTVDALDLAAAEVRERQEGDPRLVAHHARVLHHLLGDGGELVGRRRLVDRGVGEEHRALARDDDGVAHRYLADFDVDHTLDVGKALGETARDASHHAGGIARRHHAGTEHVAALVDHALHVAMEITIALQPLVDEVGVGRVLGRQPRIVDLHARLVLDAERLHGLAHLLLAADQDRRAVAVVAEHHGGADRALFLALGEDDALRVGLHLLEQALQEMTGRIEAAGQAALVLRHIGDVFLGDAGIHRRLRDGGRDLDDQARIERHRHDVVGSVAQAAAGIGAIDLVGHVLARELGQRLGGGDLHLLVDRRGAHVESAAEDVGESQHVVDLVGIVRAPRGDDCVAAGGAHVLRCDLGVGIGHGEDDRLGRHRLHHVLGDRALDREAEEHVGAFHGFFQRARLGADGVGALPLVHALGAALVDHALGVAQDRVLVRHAHRLHELDAGDRRGARTVHHHLDVLDVAAGEVQRIDETGGGDDRGAMLVVMEDRDVHQLAQALLDDEAFRRLDVLEVDAAEGRPEIAHAVHELVDILGVDLQVDAVDVGEPLEEDGLAFHHRLAGQRPDVAEAEHRRTVGDHGHQVALDRVVVGGRRVLLDRQAGSCDARRIGQGQVALRDQRLAGDDLDFSGPPRPVHDQRIAVEIAHLVADHFFRAFARHMLILSRLSMHIGDIRPIVPASHPALQRSRSAQISSTHRPHGSLCGVC